MSDSKFQLENAPIIEAVLDIDCALPSTLKMESMEETVRNSSLPVILDIAASRDCRLDPQNWEEISAIIHSLRALKNQVFKQSLTEPCLSRY